MRPKQTLMALAASSVLLVAPSAALADNHEPPPPGPAPAPQPEPEPPAPVVVVADLDNPRQLSWDGAGDTLVIAEAGRGGSSA